MPHFLNNLKESYKKQIDFYTHQQEILNGYLKKYSNEKN